MIFAERLLHRVQLLAVGEALDGEHVGAVGLHRQHGAGLERLAVDMDHAAAALRGVAADMGPGQPQDFPQQLDQQGARLDGGADGFAVHRQRNGRHGILLMSGSGKRAAIDGAVS